MNVVLYDSLRVACAVCKCVLCAAIVNYSALMYGVFSDVLVAPRVCVCCACVNVLLCA